MFKKYLLPVLVTANTLTAIVCLFFGFTYRDYILKQLMQRPLALVSTRIVMLGDSHIKGGKWNALLGRCDIFNAGTGGFTSENALHVIPLYVRPLKPKYCFVLTGHNDIKMRLFTTKNTLYVYQQIADSLRRNGITPIFQTPFYSARDDAFNQKIDSLNTSLRQYCQSQKIELIDIRSSLCQNHHLRYEITDDGSHLNEKGYELWTAVLKRYIASHHI